MVVKKRFVGTAKSFFQCSAEPKFFSTGAMQSHNSTVSQHNSSAASQHCSTTALQHHSRATQKAAL